MYTCCEKFILDAKISRKLLKAENSLGARARQGNLKISKNPLLLRQRVFIFNEDI